MKYSSRFFLYAPVAGFLLILGGICLHWFWAANLLSSKLDELNGKAIAPGITLRFASKEMAGFPFRLDAKFTNFDITTETRNGLARWSSEGFAFHSLTYGGAQQVFEAAGKQTITWTGADGQPRQFTFVPGSLRASAVEGENGVARFDLDMVDMGSAALTAGRVQFHLRKEGDVLQYVTTLDGVTLSEKLVSAFGDTIRTLRFEGNISKAAAFEGLRAGTIDWRTALEDWRIREGTLQVTKGDISWNGVALTSTGTLALDDDRRPKGILRLNLSGLNALAEEAAKRNIVKGPNLGLAAGLLDQTAQADGKLSAALAFKEGLAYVEQTPVATLDTLY